MYKTHKQGTPVRLLTSGCNTAIENLAIYIERVCLPLTEELPSRIKNTSHLLDIIDNINSKGLSANAILVSFDIVNMFPSIDNNYGLKVVATALENRVLKSPSTECIVDGLKICLHNNNSIFSSTNLLQTNGTATGAPNSCSYADLAVSPIDDQVFKAMESSYSELRYYGRYRDDCLAIWDGSRQRLQSFFSFLNSLNKDLQYTMEIGGTQLCFLDVKLSIMNGRLETTVYSKPTNSHLYLHSSSCHSKSSIKGIPKGVALRLRRLCSTDNEFDAKAVEYEEHLKNRGYNKRMVRKPFADIRKKSREDARLPISKENGEKKIIFSTKYNPRGPNVNKIVKEYLPILQQVPILNDLFPKNSVMVANKRENNLVDLMLRSDPYNIKSDIAGMKEIGYVKCGRRCDSCENFVIETTNIKSHATGRRFSIRRETTCKSENVVYVACCQTCGKQGVGSTVSWKPRLANYKSHIKKDIKTCMVVRHFIEDCPDPTLSNLKFVIVDAINNIEGLSKKEIDSMLLEKEKFWIGTLITQHKGLNGSHDWCRRNRTEKEKF